MGQLKKQDKTISSRKRKISKDIDSVKYCVFNLKQFSISIETEAENREKMRRQKKGGQCWIVCPL